MELGISTHYFSNSFLRIPAKLYENIAYHRRMQANTLLGKSVKFNKMNVTLKFNMAVNGKT